MTHFFVNLLFPKYVKILKNKIDALKSKNYNLKKDYDISKNQFLKLKKENKALNHFLLNNQNNYSTVYVRKDKNDTLCLISLSPNILSVYKYNDEYFRQKLHVNYRSGTFFHVKSKNYHSALFIEDIQVTEENCNLGLGSLAMEILIKKAKSNKIKIITGELSHVDKDNKERRYHFYRKFGFDIDFYKDDGKSYKYARVTLSLNNVSIDNNGQLLF